ncbi:MAG: hypothetical protein FRX49_04642 [Trebouxia sp. A1-2]|nr:MAG: hypothetical protein FRX49_04642 [Trebouxia sp. A1-2]
MTSWQSDHFSDVATATARPNRAHHLAILYELGNNRAHDVNGDGKTDPSGGACVGEDGGVDPNHPALSHKPWSVSVKPPSSAAQEKKSKDYTFQRQ